MREVFLTIVRMGLVSSYVVLVVLFVRYLLRRFPKRYSYLLWSVVFFRLVCPIGIEGSFSLVPDILFVDAEADIESGKVLAAFYRAAREAYPVRTSTDANGTGDTGKSADAEPTTPVNDGRAKVEKSKEAEDPGSVGIPYHSILKSADTGETLRSRKENLPSGQINIPKNSVSETIKDTPKQTKSPHGIFLLPVLCVIWIVGVLVFWLIWAHSIRRFRKKLIGAVRLEKGVYESSSVTASFVDGVFHPVIYLAPGLSGAAREYVLCHERVHIKRKDPQIKAAALFLVSIYWFHPLIWLAFKKMCEDMEMSCDERVVELLGAEIKKEYSSTLLKMAQGTDKASLLAAFGGNEVKSRVKNILSYRRPKTWIAIVLLVVVAAVGIGLGVNPGRRDASAASGNVGNKSDPDGVNVPEGEKDSGKEEVPEKIKEKPGIKQYEYPAEFSMGDNLKTAIIQLALSYDNFDRNCVDDENWKEIFVAKFIQNTRASFDYLDLLSEKTGGQIDMEELYYIHYSLTGMELDFSSYADSSLDRYDAASSFKYGSISGYDYKDTGNGGIVTVNFESGFDWSDSVQKRELTVILTKNPYSCFDGYSIISIASKVAVGAAGEYTSVLTAYHTALKEEWGKQKLSDGGFSILAAYCYGEDTLGKIGYSFLDLDGDGTEELLIGAIGGDDFIRQQIFELYCLKDGVPTQIFAGQERDRYYLCFEGGSYLIINEGSSSASDSEWSCNMLREGELIPVQTIVSDSSGDTIIDNSLMGQMGEDAVSDEREKEDAQAIIKAYKEYRIVPEYIPFSDFERLETGNGEDKEGGETESEETGKKVNGDDLENQIDLIFRSKKLWEQTDDFVAEETYYTVVDLNGNGRLELIAASCQGTGHYTYADIYEVSEDGNSLVHYTHTVPEGDSQADIIWGVAPVYYNEKENIYRYVFDDLVRADAAYYYESKKSLELKADQILETTLAYRITEYINSEPVVTYGGENGMRVTNEQEYMGAADKIFEEWQKGMAYFLWFTAPEQREEEEDIRWLWYKRLQTSYRSFSVIYESFDPLTLSGQEDEVEAEFLQSWKEEAKKEGYSEADALKRYEKFQRENVPLEPGDTVSALCLEDYDGDGVVDCFFAVSKYGDYYNTKWDGSPHAVVWGNISGKFCQIALWEDPVIALTMIAGDVNHDGFTELVIMGDTGACGLSAIRPHWMFLLRGGEIQKMNLPSQRDYGFDMGIGRYEISVYATEDDSICCAVLEQDGREALFMVFEEQREENYAAKLDEAAPGWRDNKEGFGGNGGSYFDLEIITQDGREYLVGREYLFIYAVNGVLGRANLVFDWNENSDVYVKDFYVEPSV